MSYETLLDKIGTSGALALALKSAASGGRIDRVILLPATIGTYLNVLAHSTNVREFEEKHVMQKCNNWVYALFRPSGRETILTLKSYGID